MKSRVEHNKLASLPEVSFSISLLLVQRTEIRDIVAIHECGASIGRFIVDI
jgi:hypothetical protein